MSRLMLLVLVGLVGFFIARYVAPSPAQAGAVSQYATFSRTIYLKTGTACRMSECQLDRVRMPVHPIFTGYAVSGAQFASSGNSYTFDDWFFSGSDQKNWRVYNLTVHVSWQAGWLYLTRDPDGPLTLPVAVQYSAVYPTR